MQHYYDTIDRKHQLIRVEFALKKTKNKKQKPPRHFSIIRMPSFQHTKDCGICKKRGPSVKIGVNLA